MLPGVSIIVPAYNAEKRLARGLTLLREIAESNDWELVLVDDGSTDGTAEVGQRLGVRTVRMGTNSGVAATRNRGARETSGAILVFIDADIVIDRASLEALVQRLDDDPGLHATGAIPAAADIGEEWSSHFVALRSAWAYHAYPHRDIEGISSFQSECGAIRRTAFEATGGFPEFYPDAGMEEFDLGHTMERLGFRNVLLASAAYRTSRKPMGRRLRDLERRSALWLPLLLKRRRFESAGMPGNPMEALSGLLSGVLFLALAAIPFWPRPAMIAALIAAAVQLLIERRFLAFAGRQYGVAMVLYAWPGLQLLHAATLIGCARGFIKMLLDWGAGSLRRRSPSPEAQ